MKSRFDDYLDNMPNYAQQRAIEKNTNNTILDATRACVTAALNEGQIGKLGRVFNEYPLEYSAQGNKFYAVSSEVETDWIQRYETLITQGKFELIVDDKIKIITSPEIETRVKDFLAKIIKQGCQDLLAENGVLKPSVIQFLGLDSLIQSKRQDQAALDTMTFQVLYSYCTQLVFASLGDPFLQAMNNHIESNVDKIQQIDYFNRFFPSLCAVLDKNGRPQFTQFFTDKVLDHVFENSLFSENGCANFLKYVPLGDLSGAVNTDMKTINPEIKDVSGLYEKMAAEKGKFWRAIMEVFQKEKDLLRLQAVWEGLPIKEQEIWANSANNLPLPLSDQEFAAWKEAEEAKKLVRPLVNVGNLLNYSGFINKLNARDNYFLIDHLVHTSAIAGYSVTSYFNYAMQTMYLSSDETTKNQSAMLKELQEFRFNEKLIQQPTLQLFEMIHRQSSRQDLLRELYKDYFPELAQQLELSQSVNPISIFIKNQQWGSAVIPLINRRDIEGLTSADLAQIKYNISALTKAFCKLAETLDEKERYKKLTQVIEGKNALGMVIHGTDKNARIDFIKEFIPDIQQLGLVVHDADNLIASAIKHKQWDTVMSILINQPNMDNISKEDKQALHDNYPTLQHHLIDFLENQRNGFVLAQRIAIADQVLAGNNAMGMILKTEPRTWMQGATKLVTFWWAQPEKMAILLQYKQGLEKSLTNQNSNTSSSPPSLSS
jgi:hypothetical protein